MGIEKGKVVDASEDDLLDLSKFFNHLESLYAHDYGVILVCVMLFQTSHYYRSSLRRGGTRSTPCMARATKEGMGT